MAGLSRTIQAITVILACFGLCRVSAASDLDLESSVGAWLDVRNWVDDMEAPDASEYAVGIPGASAVCVILRHRGRVVGFGLAHAEDTRTVGQSLVWTASAQAINLARKDDVISSLPDSVQQEAGKQLTLEMEIAGPLQALMGPTFQAATERLRPGIHGMALRHDDRWWVQFPAQLRLTNAFVGPERLYSFALASELSPRQIESLRDQGKISLYGFETIDLAQATPEGLPTMLVSGDMEVVQSDVTSERLVTARDDLARHLLSRIFKTDDGYRMVGSFTPMTSSFDQKFVPTHERAFVALALARYSALKGLDPALSEEARTVAVGLLTNAAQPSTRKELDPISAAAWCLAAASLELEDDQEYRKKLITFLELMIEADDVDVRKYAHDIVLVAAALSAYSPDDRELARAASLRASDVLPSHLHMTLLPWLSWIERDNRSVNNDEFSTPRLELLQEIREQILELQVQPEADLTVGMNAGGFLLKPGVNGVTSQSLRPGIFLVETTDDPAYSDPERQAEFERSKNLFLRYLLQLSCREDVSGSWRQPDRIQGGIRKATWDARMDAMAQAMALIALSNATQ
ncbi:MAG: hypothetical protein P8M22_01485 [Phycisphaerales bacterium]|nr:hypothetical protein [Phycisphaerales bacterium]